MREVGGGIKGSEAGMREVLRRVREVVWRGRQIRESKVKEQARRRLEHLHAAQDEGVGALPPQAVPANLREVGLLEAGVVACYLRSSRGATCSSTGSGAVAAGCQLWCQLQTLAVAAT